MGAELLAVVMGRPTAYSALTESIAALADIPMDEATRYRSAFAVLKRTQSRSLEQVVQAVDVHLGVLDAEIARFKGQSKTAEDGEITARVAEVAAINTALTTVNQQIAQLRAQTDARIAQLQDELVQKQARAAKLTREAEQKKNAIQQTQQNFEAAITLVQNTLAADKTKLLQYLGQGPL
jgi:chromosome segregation ATPase